MKFGLVVLAVIAFSGTTFAQSQWTAPERTTRHTCASDKCGVLGPLRQGATVYILETHNGWARIAPYYSAECRNDVTAFVVAGDARCKYENGINAGQMAQWVAIEANAPGGAAIAADTELVAQSDDYSRYAEQFLKAARSLVASGRCNRRDFIEIGGWVRSSEHPHTYFTYCGGMVLENRIYLDVQTGLVR